MKIIRHLNKLLPLANWCIQCNETGTDFPFGNFCSKCAETLPDWDSEICPICFGKHKICPFNKGWRLSHIKAVFSYDEPVSKLITSFKYGKNWICGKVLSDITADRLKRENFYDEEFDFVAPVPSSRKKLYLRGFNHSVWLAGEIFSKSEILIADKIKHTPEQASLKKKLRMTSLRGKIFAIDKNIRGKKILVFDDVMTTGTTLKTFVREVYRSGAKSVSALVVARSSFR